MLRREFDIPRRLRRAVKQGASAGRLAATVLERAERRSEAPGDVVPEPEDHAERDADRHPESGRHRVTEGRPEAARVREQPLTVVSGQ